jgi:hypothetical protein
MQTHQLALTISGYGQINPSGIPSGDIGNTIIANGVIFLLVAAVILTLFYMITAGVNWITSGGDKAKITQARGRITNAILGLVLIFLSFFLVTTVGKFFGLTLF